MPDTIDTIVPEGTPTKVKPAGRFLPLLQPDESPIQSCLKALLPFIVLVGGHSCPIQLIQSCLKALLPFIVLVGGHSCPIQFMMNRA